MKMKKKKNPEELKIILYKLCLVSWTVQLEPENETLKIKKETDLWVDLIFYYHDAVYINSKPLQIHKKMKLLDL